MAHPFVCFAPLLGICLSSHAFIYTRISPSCPVLSCPVLSFPLPSHWISDKYEAESIVYFPLRIRIRTFVAGAKMANAFCCGTRLKPSLIRHLLFVDSAAPLPSLPRRIQANRVMKFY